jgi:hypothetical protein
MSYEPSHRRPPRQERWPNATPGEGWPAYQQGDGSRAWEPAEAFAGSRNGYAGHASNGYAGHADNGYGATSNGHGDAWGGRGTTADGYGAPWDVQGGAGYGGAGYGEAGHGYAGSGYESDGYAGNGYESNGYAGNGYAGNGYAGNGYESDGYAGNGSWAGGNGYGTTTAYPTLGDGYADGFDGAADGYTGAGSEEYYEAGNGNGYDGWDGYAQPGHEFTGSAGYLAQDEYPALDPTASSVLVAPDTMGEWWRQADRGDGPRQDPSERGPVVGAVTGLLAAAVAVGVATFAAVFVRPQASPVTAVAGVFIDHLPATLRNHLMAHFGAHGQTVLLLGAVGLVAMVFGVAARHNPSLGVAGVAAFGLLGAFVAITRPESRASDVVPWAIGGFAGILALLWLARASAPVPEVAPVRPSYSGGRRRTR